MRIEQLSEHFFRHEFECKGLNCCSHSAPVSAVLISGLEELRALVWEKVGFEPFFHINSGFRCITHNRTVPSNDSSQHIRGTAADVRDLYDRIDTKLIADCATEIEAFNNGGIGLYNSFVHVDVRGQKARWDNRTK